MTELTQFEQDLIRFHYLKNKLKLSYRNYPKLKSEQSYSFKSFVQEYILLTLHSFLVSRKLILKELKDHNKKTLDLALRPTIQPILDQEKTLKKIRDEFFAHMQDDRRNTKPFSTFVNDILIKSDFRNSVGDIAVLIGRAILYMEFVLLNFDKEYRLAMEKYVEKRPIQKPRGRTQFDDVVTILEKCKSEAENNLKKYGYRFE